MKRGYCRSLLILTIILIYSSSAYEIEQPQLNLLLDSFILSIEDDTDIKSVSFKVNINKEFELFEAPQLNCTAHFMVGRWFCELKRKLREQDVVYTWLLVMRGSQSYGGRKNPISVGAVMKSYRKRLSNHNCQEAITIVRNMEGTICRKQLVFEDNFDQFNGEHWTNEIRVPDIGYWNSEFVFYNGSVEVNDGVLKISASVSNQGINNTIIDLRERCTSRSIAECYYERKGFRVLPPIVSGRINTAKYFNFKYGRIEVKAKVPKGDWLFPLITLHPSSDANGILPSAGGEIRVAFVRGNQDFMWNNISIGGDTLFGGPIFSPNANQRHQFMSNISLTQTLDDSTTPKHFGNKFHVYSLVWTVNELVLSVDDVDYGKIQIDRKWRDRFSNVPFGEMFYITLGLAAGGSNDFPDGYPNKPWHNEDPRAIQKFKRKKSNWHATWTQPSLEIDYVRVYAV